MKKQVYCLMGMLFFVSILSVPVRQPSMSMAAEEVAVKKTQFQESLKNRQWLEAEKLIQELKTRRQNAIATQWEVEYYKAGGPSKEIREKTAKEEFIKEPVPQKGIITPVPAPKQVPPSVPLREEPQKGIITPVPTPPPVPPREVSGIPRLNLTPEQLQAAIDEFLKKAEEQRKQKGTIDEQIAKRKKGEAAKAKKLDDDLADLDALADELEKAKGAAKTENEKFIDDLDTMVADAMKDKNLQKPAADLQSEAAAFRKNVQQGTPLQQAISRLGDALNNLVKMSDPLISKDPATQKIQQDAKSIASHSQSLAKGVQETEKKIAVEKNDVDALLDDLDQWVDQSAQKDIQNARKAIKDADSSVKIKQVVKEIKPLVAQVDKQLEKRYEDAAEKLEKIFNDIPNIAKLIMDKFKSADVRQKLPLEKATEFMEKADNIEKDLKELIPVLLKNTSWEKANEVAAMEKMINRFDSRLQELKKEVEQYKP